jgi:hypothetical protein
LSYTTNHHFHAPQRITGPLDHARPLKIGCAYETEFECLAPLDWEPPKIFDDLLRKTDMLLTRWSFSKTQFLLMSNDGLVRRWKISRIVSDRAA